MEWIIGNFSFVVTRKTKQATRHNEIPPSFNYEDLQKFNDPTLTYIRSLSKEEIEKRVAVVSIEHLNTESHFEKAKEILKENGIIIIPRFIDEKTVSDIENEISEIFKKHETHIKNPTYFEDNQLVIDGESRIKSYANLASYNKPVISIRQGQDKGMIDVFNVERLIGTHKERLLHIYQDKQLIRLLNLGKEVMLSNINVYINNQITKTRGFHADNFSTDYKGFIYLTDVLSLDNGPYCYVKKTNEENIWRKANIEISKHAPNKTESPFLNIENIIPVLAPKGSLVISDQSGVHRGFPQSANGCRKVLVARYR